MANPKQKPSSVFSKISGFPGLNTKRLQSQSLAVCPSPFLQSFLANNRFGLGLFVVDAILTGTDSFWVGVVQRYQVNTLIGRWCP